MIFFTSDTHFGHANVIKYSNRPFKNADEMDEEMIKRWNEVVHKDDTIYHLGDFAFAQPDRINQILSRLNGRKHFLWGNHDKTMGRIAIQSHFVSVNHYLEINVPDKDGPRHEKQMIVLCHYPMISWNKMHHGSWMLHGHCHHNLKYPFRGRIVDVGVDGWGYRPISYEQIKDRMSKVANPEFLDHHKGE